jgi:hypothetical protein
LLLPLQLFQCLFEFREFLTGFGEFAFRRKFLIIGEILCRAFD